MKIVFIFCFFFAICHVESRKIFDLTLWAYHVLKKSLFNILEFSQCEFGETCKPFQECDELKRLTQKGFLSPEERDLLRRKQCNSINRVAYVCCSGGGSPVTPEPITGSTRGNMGVTSEPSRLRAKLPKAPDCGTSLGDRVSKKGEALKKLLNCLT